MRLSRRLTGVLLVFTLAGAVAPTALAGKKPSAPPPVAAPVVVPIASPVAAPAPGIVWMVDIEALR